jgi:hypothetical protein
MASRQNYDAITGEDQSNEAVEHAIISYNRNSCLLSHGRKLLARQGVDVNQGVLHEAD